MDYSDLEIKYSLPKGLLGAIASVETGGHPDPDRAISKSGAIGRMQLLPSTAKELGVDPYDPQQNLEGGAKYIKWLLDTTKDSDKAIVAYNYGIGNLWKAEKNAEIVGGSWKDFIKKKESREYLGKVMANLGVNEIEKQPIEATKTPKTMNDLAWLTDKTLPSFMKNVKSVGEAQSGS